jgi:hypothetical protein
MTFPDEGLLAILGESRAMIESPLIQEIQAKTSHELIFDVLESRFSSVSENMLAELEKILSRRILRKLAKVAAVCPDLAAFRSELERVAKPQQKSAKKKANHSTRE